MRGKSGAVRGLVVLGKATAEQGYDLCSRDLQWKGTEPTCMEEQRKRSAVKNKAAEMTGYSQEWHRKAKIRRDAYGKRNHRRDTVRNITTESV